MKMNKKTLAPIIVLVSICIAVAALLAGINMFTAPEIEERAAQKLRDSLVVVLPGADNFEKIELNENYPSEIKSAYKADKGIVFETYVKGNKFMTVMCGVDNEGKVVAIEVISENETPGYKEKVFNTVMGEEGAYNGKSSEDLSKVLVSGATLTSEGVYKAVKAALDGYTVYNGGTLEKEESVDNPYVRTESEILTHAANLVPEAKGFDKVELEGQYEYLVSLYKERGGLGYVAYVLVISPNYGTPETEAVIHIGNDAKVEAINTLTWKTSAEGWGYVPPTKKEAEAFYERLLGVDYYSLYDTKIVTKASNTSERVLDSFNEALTAVKETEKAAFPRVLGIIITVCSIGAFAALLIYNKKRRAPYEK